MSPSKMRRTQAFQDGVCHADGGPNVRSKYWGDHLLAYELGYEEHKAHLESQHQQEVHPLRVLRRKVEDAMDRSKQNLPIASIVLDVLEDMLIYLEDKESM